MDSKKKISISFRNENQNEPKREVVRTQYEQAASVEEDKEEERPKTPVYHLPLKKNKKYHSSIRPLVTTSLTALFVSLGLGFLLLRMFVTLTDETAVGNESAPAVTPVDQATEAPEDSAAGSSSAAPQTFETYIVQAGAFSTEGKALEWQSKLTALTISSVVWERNGQYYLYVGSAPSKEKADLIADQLAAKSIETYVKPWVVKTEKEVPSLIGKHLQAHSLGDLSENDRKQLIDSTSKNEQLSKALSDWESQDDTNINWLKVAHSLE